MVTTSLWPLGALAQQAAETSHQLPTVEVTAEGTATPTSAAAEAQLNTTPQSLYQTPR